MKISDSTLRNWQRLKSDVRTKLQHRANKSCSSKTIYPLEYIQNQESFHFAQKVISLSRENGISRRDVIFSLAEKLLCQAGIIEKDHVQKVLRAFGGVPHKILTGMTVPENEPDILGFVYQCLLSEGEKNISGAYYTPCDVIREMLSGVDFSGGKNFFDPCCGSGAFLLAAPAGSPDALWGCDKDECAVFIARINLLCKYRNDVFVPHVFCCDYLEEDNTAELFRQQFDLVATNPPWGAEKNRRSGESFTHFFKKSSGQLKPGGWICFLFPEAVLRIKSHAGLRNLLLNECCLEKIVQYKSLFSGVMTGYVSICARKALPGKFFQLYCGGRMRQIAVENILKNKHHTFVFTDEKDLQILEQISAQKNHYLSESIFALGIVTGDNRKKLHSVCLPGMEPVITGREVDRYVLKKAVKFLYFDKKDFQQTAKEAYYRAPEKLVYKFISGKPVFAYDDSGMLCLNSANILIPQIPGMSIKTVLAFLNSNFLRYYYRILFGDVKILKGNLMQLPFPEISQETAVEIDRLTDYILKGDQNAENTLQALIYHCYQLSSEQIQYVEKVLSGEGK